MNVQDEFHPFIQPALADHHDEGENGQGPDITQLIGDDERHGATVAAIGDVLRRAFSDVEEYGKTFESLRQMFLENRKMGGLPLSR